MFGAIRDLALKKTLDTLKEKLVNPNIAGIATVKEMAFKNKRLYLTLVLDGLESHPVEIVASDIVIAEDGSSISIGMYDSNMPFAMNALNRFATRPFQIPEGGARMALKMARPVLGL